MSVAELSFVVNLKPQDLQCSMLHLRTGASLGISLRRRRGEDALSRLTQAARAADLFRDGETATEFFLSRSEKLFECRLASEA